MTAIMTKNSNWRQTNAKTMTTKLDHDKIFNVTLISPNNERKTIKVRDDE